jgi:KDO2-lipid IV(A) lauroyltransferase
MREFLTYGTYRLLGAFAGPLPPRVGYGLGRPLGAVLHATSPQLRRVLAFNFRHVLGPDASEEEVQTVVRHACVNYIKAHYDLFRLSRLSNDEIQAMTRLEGQELMHEALARGKGVIMFSAHFGNVDILIQMPKVLGVPISTPVEHVQPERLFQYTLSLRTSHGLQMYPTGGPMIGLYRALKRGEVVGLAADRGIDVSTRQVEFFGSPASLPEGPVRLALRTGAALVPGFGRRLSDNSFYARIEPALDLPNTGDLEVDVPAGMKMVVKVLERIISQEPEQWLLARPVWPMGGDDGKAWAQGTNQSR